jgi:AbrB family looped-hinge helix DNA binding protein
MNTRITIDNAGRVVLPKPLRDELDLGPGDFLDLESVGDKIILRPVRAITPLTKEQGVWVFRTGQPLAASVTDAVLHDVRNDRDQHNLDKLAPKA